LNGGSPAIEAAAKVKTVLFDKTGTLTSGQLSVVETSISPEWRSTRVKETILWTSVLLAEENSTHPVACTMAKEARRHLQELFGEPYSSEKSTLSLVEFTNVQGLGMECILQLQGATGDPEKSLRAMIGSWKFIASTPTISAECFLERLSAKEEVPENVLETFVMIDGVLAAVVNMTDEIRFESRNMVSQLKRCGYNVGMVSKHKCWKDLTETKILKYRSLAELENLRTL
jgi:Cu+-exporting ATPase